jgi:hypothetical protein
MLALGLLTAAQLVDLDVGRLGTTIKEFQSSSNGSTSILSVLGLALVATGTAAAAVTFRARKPIVANTGPLLQRLSPLAKGTMGLLGLALGVVGLAWFLSSSVAMVLCLLLLALGTTTGILAVLFAAKDRAGDGPGPLGISSRGWVSLAFLALAGGVLGTQESHLLGRLGSWTAAGEKVVAQGAAIPVGDEPSVWSTRKYERGQPDSTDPERARLERELFEMRRRLAALEFGTRPDRVAEKPAAAPADRPVVDLAQWNHKPDSVNPVPGGVAGTEPTRSERDRLAKELADAQRKLADLEAVKSSTRPPESSTSALAPATVDVSRWRQADSSSR